MDIWSVNLTHKGNVNLFSSFYFVENYPRSFFVGKRKTELQFECNLLTMYNSFFTQHTQWWNVPHILELKTKIVQHSTLFTNKMDKVKILDDRKYWPCPSKDMQTWPYLRGRCPLYWTEWKINFSIFNFQVYLQFRSKVVKFTGKMFFLCDF